MAVLWVGFWIFWAIAVLVIVAYGWVIMFGAPYVPTLRRQRAAAIKLLDLKPGQHFIDLGCGDGGLLILAAKQGWQAEGYELNPFLALLAWLRTRRYGRQVKIYCRSFWRADLSRADGIFVFLIGHYMKKLDRLINEQPHPKLLVVSNGFEIPGRRTKLQKGALLLYEYPPKR